MAMLGERVPAREARDWGLINRVIPDEAFEAESAQLLARLAAGPTRSYAGAKRQLNNWLYSRMHEQLDLEARVQQEVVESRDFAEGVAAFGDRRPAVFEGR
jgi:2-(1,2-epoxy-1,2-dihydrophenyl)acetyl-CoA isomerase